MATSFPVTILSVDDQEANRYVRQRVMHRAGFSVLEATTGAEALQLLDAAVRGDHPLPDLVVLDVRLPDIDGYEVCRRIRSRPETAQIPILEVSCVFTETEHRVRGLDSGADAYLPNPEDSSELLAAIRAMLRRHRTPSRALREWLEREKRVGVVLQEARTGVWEWNLRSGQITCSAGHAELFGMLPHEFDGSYDAFRRRVHPDDLPHLERAVRRAREERSEYRVEYRAVWPDGGTHWIEGRGRFFFDEKQPVWMTGVVREITDVKELERALQERSERSQALTAELTAENQRKDEFLAMLAHELRNPLSALTNVFHLLEEVGAPDPRAQRYRSIADRQLRHLTRLLDDLLDVSRIARNKVSIECRTVSLAALVEQSVEAIRPELTAHALELSFQRPPANLQVEADPTRIQQVVANLLSNAVRYNVPGGRIEVTLSAEGPDESEDGAGAAGFAVLRVRDTGIGISPEMLPRIWELYVRADRPDERADTGMGIGLALVKRLVDLHGGTVAAASEGLGTGSEFTVRLPLREPGPEDSPGASETRD